MDIREYNGQSLRLLNRALDPSGDHSSHEEPGQAAPPPIRFFPVRLSRPKVTAIPAGWVKRTKRSGSNQYQGPVRIYSPPAEITAESFHRGMLRRR